MADHPLDKTMQELVALLYGELSPEKEAALRERIAREPELRGVWEDLSGAHAFLKQAPSEEEAPGFVFLATPSARRAGRRRGLAAFLPAAPWAAAAAAVLVAVLAWNQARVAGLDASRAHLSAAQAADRSAASARSAERSAALAASMQQEDTHQARALPAEYVRRDELKDYQKQMTDTMATLLNEYGQTRENEIANVLQIALSDLSERQGRDYRDLRGRIDNVALGLAQEQFKTNLQVEYLMQEGQRPEGPARGTPQH